MGRLLAPVDVILLQRLEHNAALKQEDFGGVKDSSILEWQGRQAVLNGAACCSQWDSAEKNVKDCVATAHDSMPYNISCVKAEVAWACPLLRAPTRGMSCTVRC